jgi:hypothetical protein
MRARSCAACVARQLVATQGGCRSIDPSIDRDEELGGLDPRAAEAAEHLQLLAIDRTQREAIHHLALESCVAVRDLVAALVDFDRLHRQVRVECPGGAACVLLHAGEQL